MRKGMDGMARKVVDVDDEMLAQAAKTFGTAMATAPATTSATVNVALEEAVKRRKRESFFGWLAEGGLPDLTGPVEPADTAARA